MSTPDDRFAVRRRRVDGVSSSDAAPESVSAPAPAAGAAQATPSDRRAPIDLGGMASIADMDPKEIAAMMNAFVPASTGSRWRPGQRVRARVSRVTASTVFFDIGGKADAAMDRAEVPEDLSLGQELECFVGSMQDGELKLTRSLSGDSTREMLGEARENGIPVNGKVTGRNDHGFEVQLSGGVRAFCPLSQIDHTVDPDLDSYVGRTMAFTILDVRGRDAIVSHRTIAQEEAKNAQGQLLTEVKEGETYTAVVVSLRDFGAFVRLPNGLEGLVHLSNIGKARINHPKDALTEGQEVNVKVLSVDMPRQRLNLGIRQAQEGTAMSETRVDKARLSAGSSGFGTFAGMLSGVDVSPKKPAAKAAAKPAEDAPKSGVRRVPPTRR